SNGSVRTNSREDAMPEHAVRHPDLVMLDAGAPRRSVRSQNFLVDWIEGRPGGIPVDVSSAIETMLILFDSGATITGGAQTVSAPRRSVVVLRGGSYRLDFAAPGRACVLSTERRGVESQPLNAASY